MPEIFFSILLFLAIVTIAGILFAGWLVVKLFKFGGWIVGSGRPEQRTPASVTCKRPDCLAINPESARFCRRCGRSISSRLSIVRAA